MSDQATYEGKHRPLPVTTGDLYDRAVDLYRQYMELKLEQRRRGDVWASRDVIVICRECEIAVDRWLKAAVPPVSIGNKEGKQ